MDVPGLALALAPALQPALQPSGETLVAIGGAFGMLLLAGLFSTLRDALDHCSPLHVLEEVSKAKHLTEAQKARREQLETILESAPRLTTTAALLEVLCILAFGAFVLQAAGFSSEEPLNGTVVGACSAATFALLVGARLLPPAVMRAHGEAFLAVALPSFWYLAGALYPIVWPVDLVRRMSQRLFGLEDVGAATRILVEDLRDVIEDTGMERALPASGLELIENVMDFHDVDVAAVMTPRTEIEALEISSTPDALLTLISNSSYSRIPLYEETIDTVVGWISARDVVRALHEGNLEEGGLRALARPVKFVPETKHVPQLLEEFRQERFKLAIVLDEYGGTAGLVTLTDVTSELVGEIHDEYDPTDETPSIRSLGPAFYEVSGAQHVSEVNEALDLDLPEEDDYETLAGFILARLGRFPKPGDALESERATYTIAEATDRRILVVHVRVAA